MRNNWLFFIIISFSCSNSHNIETNKSKNVVTVTSENNEKYHKLISAFHQKTGLPVLLNTSFNGPDEPIVETPENALRTFLKRNIYALVINNYLITRK